ncbi:hypothetical protein DRO38_05860 [Candidatus Bathyarchaeota archaeon]|nr:MAG: hypothetical protein DRO38_05860 [Candidatus Bathyarchaeota archaeon]
MINIILGIIIFLTLWTILSFKYHDIKHYFDMKGLEKESKNTKMTSKSYSSVDELLVDIKRKMPWYYEFKIWLRVKIENFIDVPRDVYRFFKRGLQRWKRGWADEDVWSIDWFLTDIIPPMIERLKKTKHGVPCGITNRQDEYGNDKEFEEAKKVWNKTLDDIKWTFEMARNIQERHWHYQPSNEWTSKKYHDFNKIWTNWKDKPKPRAMTLEECKKYERGWKLFQKWFFALWD